MCSFRDCKQQAPSSVEEVGAVAQVQTGETAEVFACLRTELNTAYATCNNTYMCPSGEDGLNTSH